MDLSIVLGHLDRPEAFHKLYDSVAAYTHLDWEMVVSDASVERPLDRTKYPENIVIIKEQPRLGHSRGYNQAFYKSTGKWAIWLNDDCEVTPNWAIEAIGFMERNPWVGMGALYYCNHAEPYYINSYWQMPYANFGILDREFGNQIGWFDEDVEMYGADNSISFKVYLSGKAVRGIPYSRIIHKPFIDKHRVNNEAKQPRDSRILSNKYSHLTDVMLKVNRRLPVAGI